MRPGLRVEDEHRRVGVAHQREITWCRCGPGLWARRPRDRYGPHLGDRSVPDAADVERRGVHAAVRHPERAAGEERDAPHVHELRILQPRLVRLIGHEVRLHVGVGLEDVEGTDRAVGARRPNGVRSPRHRPRRACGRNGEDCEIDGTVPALRCSHPPLPSWFQGPRDYDRGRRQVQIAVASSPFDNRPKKKKKKKKKNERKRGCTGRRPLAIAAGFRWHTESAEVLTRPSEEVRVMRTVCPITPDLAHACSPLTSRHAAPGALQIPDAGALYGRGVAHRRTRGL